MSRHRASVIAPTRTPCRYPRRCTQPAESRGLCHSHYVRMAGVGKLHTTMVPAGPLAALVREHLARGRSVHNLACAAGVDHGTLRALLNGTTTTVQQATVAALTAVPLPPPVIGVDRRVRALAWLGWPLAGIAAAGGVSRAALATAMRRGRYSPTVRCGVVRAFDRLAGTPGPSRRTARRAAALGWVPPLAWYGLDIDDPTVVPDLGPQTTVTTSDRLAEAVRLITFGEAKPHACARAGIAVSTLDKALKLKKALKKVDA